MNPSLPSIKSILRRIRKRGITLTLGCGGELLVEPEDRLDYELNQLIRLWKFPLIVELKRQESAVIHLAKQLVMGEFTGASRKQWQAVASRLGL